jgi:hypothetical protein
MVRGALHAIESRWQALAAVGVVVGAMLLIAIPESRAPVLAMDEGSLLVYPTLVQAGEMPHRDFETMYGPGNLWVLSTSYRVFGPSIATERAVGFLYELCVGLGLLLLARRKGWAIAISAGVLGAGLAMLAGLYALAWYGSLALGLFAVYLSTETPHVLLGGIFGGLALVYRPDFALAIGGAAFALGSWSYIKGVLIGLCPLLVHGALIGPRVAFQTMFLIPVFHTTGRRLPLPWDFSLFWLVAVSILFGIGAMFLLPREERRHLFVVGVFAIGLLPQAFQRPDQSHLLQAGSVWVGLVPVFALSLPSIRSRPRSIMLTRIVAIACAILLLLGSSGNLGLRPDEATSLTHQGRTVYLGKDEDLIPLTSLIARIDELSHAGQRLFIGPRDLSRTWNNDTYLYFLFPRLHPASYFLEMNPGSANRPGTRLASDVASADFVVLTNKYEGWVEPNSSSQPGDPAANQVVETEFCSDATFGSWELLTPCSGTYVGGPARPDSRGSLT